MAMRTFLSRAWFPLALGAVCAAAAPAQAEGWYAGAAINPVAVLIATDSPERLGSALLATSSLQLGYQTAGFGARLNASFVTSSLDFYGQYSLYPGQAGVYFGAGLAYTPALLDNKRPAWVGLGLRGIVGYDSSGDAYPVGLFVEYSPLLPIGCMLESSCRSGFEALGAFLLGLINVQIGVNYRF
jgi:hypothetical protein